MTVSSAKKVKISGTKGVYKMEVPSCSKGDPGWFVLPLEFP